MELNPDQTPNETVSGFLDRVRGERAGLSPQLVRVADYLMEAPQDLGWYGIVEFAELCGVPPATVVRFARRFGYGQYTDLRKVFRDSMRRHVSAAMLFS